MDSNRDLNNLDLYHMLEACLDNCTFKQVSLYTKVLNKYLDQFIKIKTSESDGLNQFHTQSMNQRNYRLQTVCADLLDRLETILDLEPAVILFQYTLNLTVCKLSTNNVFELQNFIKFNPNAIVNLTSVNIPPDVLTILSLGPKFCFPANSSNWPKILSELDEFVETHLLPMEFQQFSRLISSRLQTVEQELQKKALSPTRTTNFLINALRSTKVFLKDLGKEIMILNADKGNKTVIMYKESYYSKVQEMMSDTCTYKLLDEATFPYEEILHKHHSLVDEFIKLSLIKKCDRWKYCKKLYTRSKFYGLPKTHKPNYPLRPITSTINSIGYELAKFLAEFLKNFDEQDPIHINNSVEFKQFLNNYTLPRGHILASFDVVSMFTNIPVRIALQAVKARMLKSKCNHKIINLVYRSLEFILTTCASFSADCKLYQQIKGLAMGSPLSPILSKFVMSDLIKLIFETYPLLDIGFFKIYVDDSIVSVHKSDIDNLKHFINSFHPYYNLEFTCETDAPSIYPNSHSIHFLDITIYRSLTDNSLSTCWYNKPYSSNRLLNYYSNHSRNTIKGVAQNFVNRVFRLSSVEYKLENIHTIFKTLSLNSFPTYYITKIIIQTIRGDNNQKETNTERVFVPITYSDVLFNCIKDIITEFRPNVVICGRPDNSNFGYHFSRIKDQEHQTTKQNCVVQIPCQNCDGRYIAHTKYDCNVADLTESIKDPKPSNNCTHSLERKPKILAMARSHTKTKTLFPYIHAKNSDQVINSEVDTHNLPFYKFIKNLNN
jgi:hypothetical protein